MSSQNIYEMDLDALRKQERTVFDFMYTAGGSAFYELKMGSSSLRGKLFTSDFKAGNHSFNTPAGETFSDITNESLFYKIMSNAFEVSKNRGNIESFKNYFTNSDKKRELVKNIEKTVLYANDFFEKVVKKYTIFEGTNEKFMLYSSTLRDPQRNFMVNGASEKSDHMIGVAIDFRPFGMTSNLMLRFLHDMDALGSGSNSGIIKLCKKYGINSDAAPTRWGTYYDHWVSTKLRFSFKDQGYITNNSASVKKMFDELLGIPPILEQENFLQTVCNNFKSTNFCYWFHVSFIGGENVKDDSGKKSFNTGNLVYAKAHTSNKDGGTKSFNMKGIEGPGEYLGRDVYYNNIFGKKK